MNDVRGNMYVVLHYYMKYHWNHYLTVIIHIAKRREFDTTEEVY